MTTSLLMAMTVLMLTGQVGSSFTPGGTDFSSTVCFGDSLTHNDLLGIFYQNPQDMYGDDPAEALFVKGALDGDHLNSYAIPGSVAETLRIQYAMYFFFILTMQQSPPTLIHFEIGGNDILGHLSLLGRAEPGQDGEADAVIDQLLDELLYMLTRLQLSSPDSQILLWTVPDITQTPSVMERELSETQLSNIRDHIERANETIRFLDDDAGIIVFDSFQAVREIVANPPVIAGQQLLPPPAYGSYDALFADEIHPTAVTNALIANGLIALLNAEGDQNIAPYTEEELAALAKIETRENSFQSIMGTAAITQ